MRRALFFILFLSPALARPARAATTPGKASARIAENRLNVFWESCPPGAREWEAFLSLDGGRSFPLRVTPHLSTAVRSFSWPIPWILAEDAKLRIRFGDGISEREFDVDGGWTLVPARDSRPLSPESRDFAEGPAPGEEQTAAWVEWNGSRARTVVPAAPPGARSSSEWRRPGTSWLALPSRRLAAAGPTSSVEIARPLPDLPAPRVVEFLQPSLAAFSRLNV
jgi:hypothetical protein